MSISIVSFLDTSDSSKVFKYTVDVYDDLSLLEDVLGGDLAFVSTTTGIWPFRKLKGLYEYKDSTWDYASQDLQDLAISQQAEIDTNEGDITDLQEETALLEENKLEKGTYSGTAQDLKEDIDKQTWAAFIDSELPLMNQQDSNNYEPYFGIREERINVDSTGTWNLPLPYTGEYEIELGMLYSKNSTQFDFLSRVVLDGSELAMPLVIESKDAQGTGILVPTVQNDELTGVEVNTGTNQNLWSYGKRFVNRTAGQTLSLRLEFAGSTVNIEPTIYEASLTVRYVINNNTPILPPSIGTAVITYIPTFNGFNASVEITNTSGSEITSWAVIIQSTNWVVTSNNSSCIETDLGDGNWLLENETFNGTIPDQSSVTFPFQGSTGEVGVIQSPENGDISVSGS